jgi:hypothetical protein
MPLLTAAVAAAAAEVAAAVAVAAAAAVAAAEVAEAAAVVPLAAGPLALELVLDLVAGLVAGRDLATVMVMLSDILSPVHTDGLIRTASARECFGFEGTITLGLAVGLVAVGSVAACLVAALLFGSTNARPSLVGMCGVTRRACAMSSGLTTISG